MDAPVLKLEHVDSRGEIYSITLPGDRELMLLHSKEGSLRGGHAHDVDEVVTILTGKMTYCKYDGVSEGHEVIRGGDTSFNPAGEFHMGEFLEDSWLIEWRIGTSKGKSKNINYGPWRERVDANAVV